MDGRSRWAEPVLALLGIALLTLCALGPVPRYAALTLAAVLLLGVLIALYIRGTYTDRTGARLMIAGSALLVVHNIGNQVGVAVSGSPYGNVVSAMTLVLGCTGMAAGVLLSTAPMVLRYLGAAIDSAVIGLAVASLVWVFILEPAHRHRGSSGAVMVYEQVLLLVVCALSGAAIRAAVVARQGRPAALRLIAAMVAVILADIGITTTQESATRLAAWWANGLCIVAALLIVAALTHPTAMHVAQPTRLGNRALTTGQLALLGAALSVDPLSTVAQQLLGRPVDVGRVSIGSLLMIPLVITRIGILARRHADIERQLRELVLRDELTGLANRRALSSRLTAALVRIAAGASPGVVVLYLDLDDFKLVNDTHGHAVGDRLLTAAATRLQSSVTAADLVARLGGDEFVVVLEGDPDEIAAPVIDRIERALAAPVIIGDVVASARASMGVAATRTGDPLGADGLLSRADAAMYASKRARQEQGVPGVPTQFPPVEGRRAVPEAEGALD